MPTKVGISMSEQHLRRHVHVFQSHEDWIRDSLGKVYRIACCSKCSRVRWATFDFAAACCAGFLELSVLSAPIKTVDLLR